MAFLGYGGKELYARIKEYFNYSAWDHRRRIGRRRKEFEHKKELKTPRQKRSCVLINLYFPSGTFIATFPSFVYS